MLRPDAAGPPDAAPPRPARPSTVVLAACWLGLAIVGYLLFVPTLVETHNEYAGVVRAAGEKASASESQIRAEIANGLTFYRVAIGGIVVTALVLAGLAVGVLRGNRVAQVLTWVASGLALTCCCGALLIGVAGADAPAGSTFDEEMSRLNLERTSSATAVLMIGGVILIPLGAIGAAVMLLVPASRDYFGAIRGPRVDRDGFDAPVPPAAPLPPPPPAPLRTPPPPPAAPQVGPGPRIGPAPGPVDGPNPWGRPVPPVEFRGEQPPPP